MTPSAPADGVYRDQLAHLLGDDRRTVIVDIRNRDGDAQAARCGDRLCMIDQPILLREKSQQAA